ncbi:MAG TPA: Kdo hydroxylase family protein, partial [Candidatus Methylomirabilis sp.]|nr:Kdo hydroxylase family protein [Candidatus Methylomirabilis sp.]
QTSCPKYRWEFPPGSTWLVLTDMVPHAVESGQFALEQTVILPHRALLRPEVAPVTVLERLSGIALTV